jgi:hypothetical protein
MLGEWQMSKLGASVNLDIEGWGCSPQNTAARHRDSTWAEAG